MWSWKGCCFVPSRTAMFREAVDAVFWLSSRPLRLLHLQPGRQSGHASNLVCFCRKNSMPQNEWRKTLERQTAKVATGHRATGCVRHANAKKPYWVFRRSATPFATTMEAWAHDWKPVWFSLFIIFDSISLRELGQGMAAHVASFFQSSLPVQGCAHIFLSGNMMHVSSVGIVLVSALASVALVNDGEPESEPHWLDCGLFYVHFWLAH